MKAEIKERIDKINRGQVPEGYKKSKFGIIPEDWDIKKLKEVTDYVDYRGKTPRKVAEGVFLVTAKNIKEGYIDYNISKEYVSEEEYDLIMKRGKPKIGDVLFTTEAPLGNVAQVDRENIALAQRVIKFRGKNNLSNDYLKYYLLGEIFQSLLKNKAIGSTVLGIQGKQLHNLEICVPLIEEQQKIADILSTWDKAIELKEKLIEQKKEQKKGLMQRLLTGKVRLPGFKGEWKEVRLGSIGSAYNGLTGKNKEDFGSGKPYIPYKNVFNGSRINIDQLEYVQISETENQNKVKYGDIIFTASSETPEEVGMSSVLLDHVDELYLNSFCFGYRLNDFNTLIPEFAQYLFRGNVFRKELLKLAQGSTRFNLSKNEVLKIKIKIPGLEEQKKIAFVLTIFDREIDLLEQELEALKQQKKGLMQLLLTGKVRVKC
ncbi:restriction endonuclease subunit S [Parageobacillus thermoglucosidasius]|uniref:restriction endonuclease subunit S n=1 Tax=Parageobacillus thermoglucosidasius TaxID=1426 RepID=UPI000B5808A8|nr:restriction endonuclease subunit S [Parageobacillus thermoglucosidasius]OUM89888.1 MAG: hypothetical protein BAA00_01645 [Parageobacillus thermoglucosidasius]